MEPFIDLRDELINESAKELRFTRPVIRSLLCRWTSKNLNYHYSKMVASGLNLNHATVARLICVSPATEKEWFREDAYRLPRTENLSALSQLFGCSLLDLIEENTQPSQEADVIRNNYPPLSCPDQIADFRSRCAKINESLRATISKNLEYHYNLMLNRGERINHSIISRLCGVSPATVHRWFNNCEQLPKIDNLKILSFIFDCAVSELIKDSVPHNIYADSPDSHYVETYEERLERIESYYFNYGDEELIKAWSAVYPDGYGLI